MGGRDDASSLEPFKSHKPASGSSAAAINSEYAAYSYDGDVYVQSVASPDLQPTIIQCPAISVRSQLVLALSDAQTNLIAVSSATQVLVFDIASSQVKFSLSAVHRAVTALTWSPSDASVLATGAVDGTICLWDLNKPIQPRHRLSGATGVCQSIAFSLVDEGVLASAHGRTVSVWNVGSEDKSPLTINVTDERNQFSALSWSNRASRRLITTTTDGELRLYDLSDALAFLKSAKSPLSSGDDSGDDGMFGQPDGVGQRHSQPLARLTLGASLTQIQWIGERGMVGLAKHGLHASIFSAREDGGALVQLWTCKLENTADLVHVSAYGGVASLLAFSRIGVETYAVPFAILEAVAFEALPASSASARSPLIIHSHQISNATTEDRVARAQSGATMTPLPISSLRRATPGFPRTSRQLQQRRRASRQTSPTRPTTAQDQIISSPDAPSTPPPPQSMTSSLELPKPRDEDIGSPMPFLSPSIPSRKPSPSDIPPLDDSVNLSPLPTASPRSPVPSTAAATVTTAYDSDDSDDETFVDAMQGSGTFLPGGVNVPLPKACGALFAQNGQLLTFFPPRPRSLSARGAGDVVAGESKERKAKTTTVVKLFSTFGNLVSDDGGQDEGDDSELSDDSGLVRGGWHDDHIRPRFAFQPSSFPNQESWKSRLSIGQPNFDTEEQSPPKIIVGVHEVNDVAALFLRQREVAQRYRVLCKEDESGAYLCRHNASVAQDVDCSEAAEAWLLLAMLLENRVPCDLLSEDEDVLVIARRADALKRSECGVNVAADMFKSSRLYGKIRWAGHPLGSAWLIRRLLEWAEQRADMQMLACMSAVLAEFEESVPITSVTAQQEMLTKLPTYSPEYVLQPSALKATKKSPNPPIPVLRTDTGRTSDLYQSPIKANRGSAPSSRNPSLPSTPFLGSSFNTPPSAFPSLSRQGTHLSASGSASPEYHRNSFSAAAKYYAQSISDKFASYGTSPPLKKTSTSPSMSVELSVSLPSGSWGGKSVSFAASATELARGGASLLSKSLDGQGDDESYDSDRTVEDSSAPHTPKSPSGGITISLKNQGYFADDVSGCAKQKLLPEDLARMARLWQEYYVEQLRSWGLLARAAELEKVSGITGTPLTMFDLQHGGITPKPTTLQQSQVCAICLTAARGMEYICPACLHTSHLSCLEDYDTEDLNSGKTFSCPAGCGCFCSESGYAVEEMLRETPEPTMIVKKKASFTDPRRWRARIDGDHW